MERRSFVQGAGLAGILAAGSAPAFAQGQPVVKWRMASSYPKSVEALYGAAEVVCKRVAAATGGRFQIELFAGGEIVPGLLVLDAVSNGTVQAVHTAPYYYWGKDPAFTMGTALPFGLNARQMNAWMLFGGGRELFLDFYKQYNVRNMPCGNTGAQMGGWFRKEIKTPADFKGLKMRIAGFAGRVMERLGVIPQQLGGADLYPSLEKGTIDAAEWVGPYDDERLGINKVAKFYYYPGWWEGNGAVDAYFNLKAWDSLPPEYQSVLEAACWEGHNWMQARYDAMNPAALRRLVAGGTQLRVFPREVTVAAYKAAMEVYAETSAKFPNFKRLYDSMMKFRDEQLLWFRVAEKGFDDFMHTIGTIK